MFNGTIIKSTFDEIKNLHYKSEGLVLLGTGGDLNEWINGVTEILYDENIISSADPDKYWSQMYLTETTGGRKDLILILSKNSDLDIGALATWKLMFGSCLWLSDWFNIYKTHYEDEEQ